MTPSPSSEKIAASARAWLQTPYVKGQRLRRVGVDCVHFVAAVLHDFGVELPVRRLPSTLGASDPNRARAALRESLRSVPHRAVDPASESLEPGDVLVFGTPEKEGIHHLAICESAERFWHATIAGGVQLSPLSCYPGALLHVYRCLAW